MSVPSNHVHFWTRDQLLNVFEKWGVSDAPPKRGGSVLVCFPPPAVFDIARITVHDRKSTYGKLLYKAEITTSENLFSASEGGAK